PNGAGCMRKRKILVAGALSLALAACGGNPAPEQAETSGDAVQAPRDAEASSPDTVAAPAVQAGEATGTSAAGGLQDKAGNPIALLPFDIDGVPPSTAALGELPFFSLPEGYGPVNRPSQRA